MSKKLDLKSCYDDYRSDFCEFEVVTGDGNCDAKVLLIGEAPGREEVEQNKPFVGTAGKNLSQFLEVLELSREEIFITNAIKYRLSKINPKTGRKVNRPATKDDISSSIKYLLSEIDIISPAIIVTLGNVPLKAVTNDKTISIGSVHGKVIESFQNKTTRKIFPLYHPASIIYNRSLKDTYIQDLLNLKNYLRDTL